MKQTLERTSAARFAALALAVAFAAAGGCQHDTSKEEAAIADLAEDNRALDAEQVSDVIDLTIQNGIIAQHTLYPHHFTQGGATLNSLGERDVAVLAEHFRSQPAVEGVQWTLNVRRGNAPDALYSARVKAVTDGLNRGGLAADSVRVADGMPGGEGMHSERVRVVLESEAVAEPYYKEDSGSSGGQQTSGSSSGGTAK